MTQGAGASESSDKKGIEMMPISSSATTHTTALPVSPRAKPVSDNVNNLRQQIPLGQPQAAPGWNIGKSFEDLGKLMASGLRSIPAKLSSLLQRASIAFSEATGSLTPQAASALRAIVNYKEENKKAVFNAIFDVIRVHPESFLQKDFKPVAEMPKDFDIGLLEIFQKLQAKNSGAINEFISHAADQLDVKVAQKIASIKVVLNEARKLILTPDALEKIEKHAFEKIYALLGAQNSEMTKVADVVTSLGDNAAAFIEFLVEKESEQLRLGTLKPENSLSLTLCSELPEKIQNKIFESLSKCIHSDACDKEEVLESLGSAKNAFMQHVLNAQCNEVRAFVDENVIDADQPVKWPKELATKQENCLALYGLCLEKFGSVTVKTSELYNELQAQSVLVDGLNHIREFKNEIKNLVKIAAMNDPKRSPTAQQHIQEANEKLHIRVTSCVKKLQEYLDEKNAKEKISQLMGVWNSELVKPVKP